MKQARLIRISETDAGTFGLFVTGGGWWYTLELPWRGNRPNISRIPAGVYPCEWNYSPAFDKNLYMVNNVRGRSGIRIHSGNWAGDKAMGYRSNVLGCILLGQRTGQLRDQLALLNSGDAVTQMEAVMGWSPFLLTVQTGL